MSHVLNEHEVVGMITQLIVDSPEVQEYLDENGTIELGDDYTDREESNFYSERANLIFRVLGLVTAGLYQPHIHEIKKPTPMHTPNDGPTATWVKGKAASVEQMKVATDLLERECTAAWELLNAYSDVDEAPMSLQRRAHGLINVLSDLKVPGYDMS